MDSNVADNISDWKPLVSRDRVQRLRRLGSMKSLGGTLFVAFAEEMDEHEAQSTILDGLTCQDLDLYSDGSAPLYGFAFEISRPVCRARVRVVIQAWGLVWVRSQPLMMINCMLDDARAMGGEALGRLWKRQKFAQYVRH